jgi:hypothetical protein
MQSFSGGFLGDPNPKFREPKKSRNRKSASSSALGANDFAFEVQLSLGTVGFHSEWGDLEFHVAICAERHCGLNEQSAGADVANYAECLMNHAVAPEPPYGRRGAHGEAPSFALPCALGNLVRIVV